MARIISAAVIVPIALLVVIYARPIHFLIGIGIIGTACLVEYYRILRAMKIQVQPVFGYLAFWILLFAFRQERFPGTIIVALVMIAGFLSAMWRTRQPVRERAWALMSELFGIFYLALFLYPALPIRYDFGNETGLHWT